MGTPYPEAEDPRRVALIKKIGEHLGDSFPVEPGVWAFLWLADIARLEDTVNMQSRMRKSSELENFFTDNLRMTKALRIWLTHGRIKESDFKRKVTADVSDDPLSPSNIPRLCAARAENMQSTGSSSSVIPTPEGSGLASRARSRSPSKIPQPVTSMSPARPPSPVPALPRNPKSPAAKKFTRSAKAVEECKKRDKHRCLVTGGGDGVEATHIYPFSLGTKVGHPEYSKFWSLLSDYWSEDPIKAWENTVLSHAGNEVVSNLLSLAPTVHALWRNAKFALKPLELSEDQKILKVEFYWLPDNPYVFRSLKTTPENPHNLRSSTNGTMFPNCETGQFVSSGDILTFTTNDPEKRPLPSMELLRMQWLLHRLIALAGAAGVTDEELEADHFMAPPTSHGYQTDEELWWPEREGCQAEYGE